MYLQPKGGILVSNNLGEVAEGSSILSEIGRKNVEILGEKMAKPLIPTVEEVNTQID
jgi:hypothetical protein